MAPPYRSNPGGLYNSGVYPDTRPQIDIGGILGALSAGTGTVMHAMLQRKIAERENQLAIAKVKLEQARDKRESDREAREAAQFEFDKQYKTKEQRRANLLAGIIDPVPEQQTVTGVQVPGLLPPRVPRPMSPIQQSMAPDIRNLPPGLTPSAPAPMTVQQYDITPGMKGGYHPELAQKSILQDDKQAADAERERRRLEAQIKMRAITANASMYGADVRAGASRDVAKTRAGATTESARIRADATGMGAGGRGGGKTGTAAENVRFRYADGLIGTYQSYDEALKYLRSADGDELRAKGVTENHLMTAYSAWLKGTTSEAMRSQRGADPLSPSESVEAVTKTREGVGGPPRKVKPPADSGNVDLRTPQQKAAEWKRLNPKKAGESDAAYYDRYRKANP